MKSLTMREKSILAGLFLSKFDVDGLRHLGFKSFTEAFNVIGLSLGIQPASVKNYRDEFDPFFSNSRKGWHKRPMRDYCKVVYDSFGDLSLENFTSFLKQNVYKWSELELLIEETEAKQEGWESSFAKRLITGQAAEHYFASCYKTVQQFKDFEIEDTTKLGCGFDFRLFSPNIFYAVEVKGVNDSNGNIVFTSKEHHVASILRDRYFLFVVKNFKEAPFHELHQNPLNSDLVFNKVEQKIIQTSWAARV